MAQINTRILNKISTWAEWEQVKSSFKPLRGEICIVEIPANTTGTQLLPPCTGIKVGNGNDFIGDLPWIQAIAGDVSSFVKEITNSSTFATKVAAAIGYTSTTDVKTLIDSINSNFANYATLTYVNTELGKKVNSSDFETYKTDTDAALDTKVDDSEFATYKTSVDNTFATKVNTSVADAATSNDKLTAASTVSNMITTALEPVNTSIENNAENIAANLKEINALKEAIGDSAEGESLAGRVEILEGEMDVVQAATQGYTAAGSIKTAIEDAKAAGTTAQGQVGTLSTLKTDAKNNAVSAINELHDEITAEIGNRQSAVQSVSGRIDTLVDGDTDKSIRTIAAEETAKIVAGADTNYDTLKEIADWIKSDSTGAAKMANDIVELQTLHATDTDGYKTVAEEVNAGITAANLGQYAKSADVASTYATIANLTTVSNTANEAKAIADTAIQNVTTGSENGTISVDGTDVKVKGLGTAAYTASTAYATSAQGTTADSALQSVKVLGTTLTKSSNELTVAAAKTALGLGSAAYADTSAFDAAGAADTVSQAINTTISNMTESKPDTEGKGVITGITQTNGKVTATQRLIKSTDFSAETFVFYCGTALELTD